MNEVELKKAKENARQFAYMSARRKKLEKYKDILIVHVMKEIGAKEKLSVSEQKKLAKKSPEYKQLLQAIKDCQAAEAQYQWHLLQFFNAAETEGLEQSLDRKNTWNVHNI